MNKPKQIFDTLFVTSGKDAHARLARSKSALDLLIENTRSLGRQLSRQDQQTLRQYLDAVRDTEVKLAKAQKWIDTPIPAVDTSNLHLDAAPKEARLYFQTMYELIYLAFLSDSTRVATFQLGRENGEGPHDLLSQAVGLDGAHGLTHAVKAARRLEEPRHLQSLSGRRVRSLRAEAEGDARADRQRKHAGQHLAMHGSASSSFHLSRNYPIISAGGKNLGFTNGRYLKFGKGNEDNQAGAGIDTDAGWHRQDRSGRAAARHAVHHALATTWRRDRFVRWGHRHVEPGLISRWISPIACVAARPAAICRPTCRSSLVSSGPLASSVCPGLTTSATTIPEPSRPSISVQCPRHGFTFVVSFILYSGSRR